MDRLQSKEATLLSPETPFPQVGSYALLIDRDRPLEQQSAELVRILRRYRMDRDAPVTVAFPLREGASGTKSVVVSDLIDATPLTSAESREMTDLGRALTGPRVRGRKAKAERYGQLRARAIWAPHFDRLLRHARGIEARRGTVGGDGRATKSAA